MKRISYAHRYMHEHIPVGLAMADSSNYNPTPKAQELLDMLREAGDWVGRSELATKLNKNALNKWDIILLSKLADAGLIEMRQIPHHGPIGYEWQYRAL